MASEHLRRQIAQRRNWAMLLIKYSQPNDVEKVPFGARGSQQAVQAFVPLLEERGVSKEAEDWRQRLVEFGREIPAEGELSTGPRSEESVD
jgi:predicted site-specific integrase-resolvase